MPKVSQTSVIITQNASPPPRPSAPPPPPSSSVQSECGVADASNWPLLNRTNPPTHPSMRGSLAFDPKIGRIHPTSDSYPYSRVTQLPQNGGQSIANNMMRIPVPQMASPHPQVIQRMHSRQQTLPNVSIYFMFF